MALCEAQPRAPRPALEGQDGTGQKIRDPAVSTSMAAGPGLAASPMRRPRQGHPCQPGRLVQVQVRRCCSKRRRVGRRQVTATLLPEAPEWRHPFGPRQGALNWCVRSRRSRLFRRGRAQAHQSTTAAGSAPKPGSCLSRGKAAARSTARWWQADQARQLRISRSRQARGMGSLQEEINMLKRACHGRIRLTPHRFMVGC